MIRFLRTLLYILNNKSVAFLIFAVIVIWFSLSVASEKKLSVQQESQFQLAIQVLRGISVEELDISSVPFCVDYTCRIIESISIPEEGWQNATEALSVMPDSASMERVLLVEVISRIEILLGRLTHTQYDIGGTFKVKDEPRVNSRQLDCVDEAFNMYVYMNLLNNQGKLHWHRVGDLVHRGWLIDFSYPHTALSIIDKYTDQKYVLDSWFHDNGRPPELLSLNQWKSGWVPEGF